MDGVNHLILEQKEHAMKRKYIVRTNTECPTRDRFIVIVKNRGQRQGLYFRNVSMSSLKRLMNAQNKIELDVWAL